MSPPPDRSIPQSLEPKPTDDRARKLLKELLRAAKVEGGPDMKYVSEKVIKRNHAYLSAYLRDEFPDLPEEVREALAVFYDRHPDDFRREPRPDVRYSRFSERRPEPGHLAETREVWQESPRFDERALQFLFPNYRHLQWWRVGTNALDRAHVSPGDFIVVDPAKKPEPGQPVIAQVIDNQRGTAETVLRLWYPGILEPKSTSAAYEPIRIVDTDERTVGSVQPVVHLQRTY